MSKKNRFESEDSSLFAGAKGDGNGAAAHAPGANGNGRLGEAASGSGGSGRRYTDVAIAAGDGHSVNLDEAAQSRYLNYALSVITSRALPDVRDGLKPVQRRILYTMWEERLTADAKHRKCAAVVGAVLGSYHPHGDSSVYDALVRMAQPWVMRATLVDGSGNFGSMDGDSPAAYRYTECRLARISDELLGELGQHTVHFRPNFDGRFTEPVVLPTRIPNLLLNGSSGIAVGMATNIPPHNLGEVCNALLKLLEDPEIEPYRLVANDAIQGPDFPTGGHVLTSKGELREIYKTGQGSIRVRGTWKAGPMTRGSKTIHVTGVPYGVNKASLVEEIAAIVTGRKLGPLLDVRDLSTDDVCIELELKRDADVPMVMAYLFKHTALQTNFAVNMTMLVPTGNPEVGAPEKLGLKEVLWHFLHFRLDVVTRRLTHELNQLAKRIHLLEGFEKVFDALDEIIRIIRKSDGKADAAEKIIKRFALDAEQADAILELKLYKLARLEILIIQKELEEKRARAKEIQALLKSEKSRWQIVGEEIKEIAGKYGRLPENKRRTVIEEVGQEKEYSAEDFIVDEDNVVVLSRDGWVKRQKEIKDLSTTRLREGDGVLAVLPGSTKATVAFFTNFGACYTTRINAVPATTGYGEPIQSLFKFRDGEKVVAAMSMDERVTTGIKATPGRKEGAEPPAHALAVTSDGYALRFSLEPFIEESTRAGRRYAKAPGGAEGAEVIGVQLVRGQEVVIAASRQAHAMLCRAEEVNFLSGPGKGVILMKLEEDDDRVVGFIVAGDERDTLTVETTMGGEQRINTGRYDVIGRGGKGREIVKRGQIVRVIPEEPAAPVMLDETE